MRSCESGELAFFHLEWEMEGGVWNALHGSSKREEWMDSAISVFCCHGVPLCSWSWMLSLCIWPISMGSFIPYPSSEFILSICCWQNMNTYNIPSLQVTLLSENDFLAGISTTIWILETRTVLQHRVSVARSNRNACYRCFKSSSRHSIC